MCVCPVYKGINKNGENGSRKGIPCFHETLNPFFTCFLRLFFLDEFLPDKLLPLECAFTITILVPSCVTSIYSSNCGLFWIDSSMAGQTDPHVSLFSPQEVEFMAEDELVEIVPNMSMDQLNFICGDFGRFMPQIPTKVPLWLAVALKTRGKCTFRPPTWMSIDNLTQILEAERESQTTFQPLPFSYVEIARLLFDHARDDIPDMYMVRSLVEDIRDVRLHKLETNLGSFSGTSAVKISNLSAMEVNLVRPFVRRALEAFYKHDKPEPEVDRDARSSRQNRQANNEPRRPLRQR